MTGLPEGPYAPPLPEHPMDALPIGAVLVAWSLVAYAALVSLSSLPLVSLMGALSGAYGGGAFLAIFVVAPVFLAVLLGYALRLLRVAARTSVPAVRERIFLARTAFYLGIGLMLELVPMVFVRATGSRYGPTADEVVRGTVWGLAFLLPFLVGVTAYLLRHFVAERAPGERARPVLYTIAMLGAIVAVPIASLVTTVGWTWPSGTYFASAPGYDIVIAGTGLQAAFAFLLAVVFPADALVTGGSRFLVHMGLVMGSLAVASALCVRLISATSPSLGLLLSPLLGTGLLPLVSWGLVSSGLVVVSVILILVAYLGVAVAPRSAGHSLGT